MNVPEKVKTLGQFSTLSEDVVPILRGETLYINTALIWLHSLPLPAFCDGKWIHSKILFLARQRPAKARP